MRDRALHDRVAAFVTEAAAALAAETAAGAEVSFELTESRRRRGDPPLYRYQPLTGAFISERLGLLSGLSSYPPAARAVAGQPRAEAYLARRGVSRVPAKPRLVADAVLVALLERIFEERSDFVLDQARFEHAYGELEQALFSGRRLETVIAPLLGVAFEPRTPELALGDGLSLVRGDRVPEAPSEAVWGEGEEPHVLLVLSRLASDGGRPLVAIARRRFRRVLTALRLFERGSYAVGPLGWTRLDSGAWRPVPFGARATQPTVTLIPGRREEELRAFCNLVERRLPSTGEVAWALARFEMGCERPGPFEALSDYLLALRALLEPEGPQSGWLAQRLAVLCARPQRQAALAERVARAIALERAVIAGLHSADRSSGAYRLVFELGEHLRAILRDVLCGHLDADLVAVADHLLAEAAATLQADAAGGRTHSVPAPEGAAGGTPAMTEPATTGERDPAAQPSAATAEADPDSLQPPEADDGAVGPPEADPDPLQPPEADDGLLQVEDRRYPTPQAAPHSAPAGAGSVPPARHDV